MVRLRSLAAGFALLSLTSWLSADAWSAEKLMGRFVIGDGQGSSNSPIDGVGETIRKDGSALFAMTN